MSQKNEPQVLPSPPPADSGDSTTSSKPKSNAPPAPEPSSRSLDPRPSESRTSRPPPGAAVPPPPAFVASPTHRVLPRPGTPTTAFVPGTGPQMDESAPKSARPPPPKPPPKPEPDDDVDDDAPTMGPTPLLDFDAINSVIIAPPAPPPMAVPPPSSSMATTAAPHALARPPASPVPPNSGQVAIRSEAPRALRSAPFYVVRSRAYSFVLDARGAPLELGSGRFAKAYLGEERWVESKTDFRREVVIKILQRGVSDEDHLRFQMEKELLERVQGHPNIVHLFASGESEDPEFVPAPIRETLESEFVILERMELSLEERLKGSRGKAKKEELLALDMRDRVFRVLDYMIPVASAAEYAHLVRNVCHRDIKPANILLRLPDPNLRGSILEVRLADFNVAKLHDEEINFGVTRVAANSVPGTQFFQSPEQETNVIELLVNVQQGSPEVEFFED
ncbi:MAG TPA: protein kinase, partial [Polyangiaceae bacterium]